MFIMSEIKRGRGRPIGSTKKIIEAPVVKHDEVKPIEKPVEVATEVPVELVPTESVPKRGRGRPRLTKVEEVKPTAAQVEVEHSVEPPVMVGASEVNFRELHSMQDLAREISIISSRVDGLIHCYRRMKNKIE